MLIMYIVTTIIFTIASRGIQSEKQASINKMLNTIKMIFTPLNAMIVCAPLGNIIGKAKEKEINMQKTKRRLIILLVAIIVIFAFEVNYISNFANNLLINMDMAQ